LNISIQLLMNNFMETDILTDSFFYRKNFGKRVLATLIDYTLYLVFFVGYVSFFGHDNEEGGKTVEGWLALPVLLVWFVYFVAVEGYEGATAGHAVVHLKVVTLNRNKISLGQAFLRRLLDPIDILFWGIPATIAIQCSDKHQRLGDLLAKTIVVDTRDPEQYPAARIG
jgi:uncharacterized RDD family membrane protein YckC